MTPDAPRRIVVVGSLNADLVVTVPRYPRPGETVQGSTFAQFPGGKGANQAYAAAKLARGGRRPISVAMIGQVGGDGQGAWLRRHLGDAGIDVSAVGVDAQTSTGIAVISIDASGQNQIVLVAGANGTFSPERLEPWRPTLAAADVLLLQLEIPLATTLRAARIGRDAGATVILDPAPAQPLPDDLLALCDYVTPNESELWLLDGRSPSEEARWTRPEAAAAAARLRARGARQVVVKLGAAGALHVGPAGERFWPAFSVEAVDTTAAGDAWNGAFAAALAGGHPADEAGRIAGAAAAVSVTRPGAQPSMPTRAEVDERLSR